MGKVLVKGNAEKYVAPDYCEIKMSIETNHNTADKASAAALKEFEKLVACLEELGLNPESMFITEDRSECSSSRWDKDDRFTSKKSFSFNAPVDVPLINRIHDVISSGFENTTIRVHFDISNRSEIIAQLKKDAIQDSRKKADLLAEATGAKVTGIESANLEDSGSMDMDIAELDLSTEETKSEQKYFAFRDVTQETPHVDKLTPDKIKITSSIRIVWQLE